MHWLREERDGEREEERRDGLKLRAHDLALVMCDGLVTYHVHRESGAVLVLDHRDPRATRSQRYEPGIRQPYLPPHVEERGEDWA